MNKPVVALLATFALSLSAVPLFAQSGKIFDKTYPLAGRPDLQVVVDDSSVKAQSCGGCREVRIHVDTHDMNLQDFRLQETQSGNLIRFSMKRPEGMHWNFGVHRGPEVTVLVPAEANVSLRSSDGSMSLAGVTGNIDMRTSDGSLTAADARGTLHLVTSDGSITLQRVEGALMASTSDGSIHADGRFSQVDARSSDGSIDVAAWEGSSLANGMHISTSDGSVSLRVPRSVRADMDLRSGDGSVRCDLPITMQTSSNDRHSVRGSVNGGGSIVRVSTSDGSIRVTGL